ncbi:interleukin-13 [Sturnira hondurensis]|uniref:interleukin-13 n=1 Tax=Sturnira hondurensis TaxID=192404 RepID=UPI0018794941|nr:interleukin-13 [Sturnira hondurensis]
MPPLSVVGVPGRLLEKGGESRKTEFPHRGQAVPPPGAIRQADPGGPHSADQNPATKDRGHKLSAQASLRVCSWLLPLALGSMALWLTLVIALTSFGGLASPGPVPPSFTAFKELIEELANITKDSLCNGSMVWHVNLTAGSYCAALDSLMNVSECRAIQKTQRLLSRFCPLKPSARQGLKPPIQDTKVEVIQFAKDLLRHLRKMVRDGVPSRRPEP